MPTRPAEYLRLLALCAPLFSTFLWAQVQVWVVGAILTPGQRPVTAVLRIMGRGHEPHVQTYHRVLNRAVWSSWEVSRVWLLLLVQTLAVRGPIIVGIDDTIERRWGAKITARGISRDPVRSSHRHFVKTSGWRWLRVMLLVPIPWAPRGWAWPFWTVWAPAERYDQGQKRAHQTLTAWAQPAWWQVRRWLPTRDWVIVADSSFAVITRLARLRRLPHPVCLITRFRLEAGLYEPAPARQPPQPGRTRVKGQRWPPRESIAQQRKTRWTRVTLPDWYGEGAREIESVANTAVWSHGGQPPGPIRWVLIREPHGTFKTQALWGTDLTVKPVHIVQGFVMRWHVEVTFREVRVHLGVETQRPWSDLAMARTTPAWLGLFSRVTVLAHQRARRQQLPLRHTAWYRQPRPTFSDAWAVVGHRLWCQVD